VRPDHGSLTVELRSASSVPFGALVDVFNRAYEGYVIPFLLDEAILRFMVDTYDLDLDASRVAFDGDNAVGLGNLGLRGEDAWVGGVGVAAAARRQGIGELLMRALHAEAHERGVRNVWLEVIDRNESAYELYVKLGYRVVRDVEVWSLGSAPYGGGAREVPAVEAQARVHELREAREPWQRADGTLGNLEDLRGLVTDDGAAVFRVTTAVQLLQIAGEGASELLRALRAFGNVSVLNLPIDDPAADALRTLGATPAVRQREMVLEI
jgi:ribosomal protein S18 acetylase RimI-like enzyme